MAAKTLNIEVGKRLIKVCISNKKGKAYQISDSFVFTPLSGSVLDGQVLDSIGLGEQLKTELAGRGITVKDAVFSVTSSKIASREVVIPAVKDEQIKTIVTTNAADYFPIDTSKYVIDSTVLERTKTESRVLVVVIPSTTVEGYLNLAEVAGLTVESIDFGGNSQYQVLKGIGGEGVTMYITVEPDSASVTFLEAGELLLQRSLGQGGDEMISRYMAANDMPEETYVAALDALSVSVQEPEPKVDISSLEDSLSRLVGGIARSLDFFRSSKHADKDISSIVLMGSCCHLPGLKEKVGETIGVPTYWLEELSNIQGLANSINGISMFIGCLGARIAPMHFLPEEYLKKTGKGSGKKEGFIGQNFGFVILIAAIVLGGALCLGTFLQLNSNNKAIDKVERDIKRISYAEEAYNSYMKYSKADGNLQTFVDGSMQNNANLYEFFAEMEQKMPSSIVLLSADCTEEGISMNVTVSTYEEAAVAIRQLRSFESVDVITVGTVTEEADSGLCSFTMNFTYPIPETEPETVPPTEETSAQ